MCVILEVDTRKVLLFKLVDACFIRFVEGAEIKYFYKRANYGWFKVSDDNKEHKNICFALNVDTDCKPYTLQLLLRRMDEKLLEGILPFQGTGEQQVTKLIRQEAFNRTVFRDKKDTDALSQRVIESFSTKWTASNVKVGRPVYVVTVGQMKSSRIRLKDKALYHRNLSRWPSLKSVVASSEIREGTSEAEITGEKSTEFGKLAEILKVAAPITVDGKEIWVNKAVLNSITVVPGGKTARQQAEDILSKHFVDKEKAFKFLSKKMPGFKPDDKDFHFEVVEEACPAMVSKVLDCLVTLAKAANKNGAAFVIPDYMTSSSNSALIEKALEHAEFSGPVINVCRQDQAARDEATAKQTYDFDGHSFFPTGIVHSRVTHSILVPQECYSSVLAKLAKVISEPDPSLFSKEGDADPFNCKRIMVVAGGGIAVLQHIAAAVKENTPVIILRGSRRLSDYLPKLWVRRLSPHFDTYHETKRFCKDCGFVKKDLQSLQNVTLWMRDVLEKGHLNTHPLSTGIHAFRRIVQSLEIKDDALLQGMVRYCEYRSAMRNMQGPDKVMLLLKLLFGILTTLSSTLAGAILMPGLVEKVISRQVPVHDLTVLELLVCIGMITFPAVLSVIVSLQQDYNYTPKIVALNYAAALIEGEMFRYRACSGKYSDEFILTHKFDDPTANDDILEKNDAFDHENLIESSAILNDDDHDADHGFVDEDEEIYDTLSIRARWFTERLIKIGEKVPIFDCPDPNQTGPSSDEVQLFSVRKFFIQKKKPQNKKKRDYDFVHLPSVLEKLKKLRGVKEIADDSLEEWASELRYGTLSGEDYANLRLKIFLKRFEDEADGLEKCLFVYKVAIYGIGVFGGLLSLTGFEVRSFH